MPNDSLIGSIPMCPIPGSLCKQSKLAVCKTVAVRLHRCKSFNYHLILNTD
nr:MAG TPA: hypothetical protein [Caudoviricetes sp.]